MARGRDFTSPPQPLPYRFTLDGAELIVRDRPTSWWIKIMSAQAPGFWLHGVLFNLEGDGTSRVVGRLMDPADGFDLDDAEEMAEEVLARVMGMEMWTAHRLLVYAFSNWMAFDGWCLTQGFSPAQAVPARVATAVYAWRLSHCEKKNDVTKLHAEIYGPPPAKRASGRLRDAAPRTWNDAAEASAFDRAMADMGKA